MFEKALGKLKPRASFGATSARHLAEDEREPSISGKFKVTGILEVGKEVNMALILKNLTSDMKTVTVNMTAWTIVYNGTLVHEVWKDSVTISLDPNEGNSSCGVWGGRASEVAEVLLGLESSCWNGFSLHRNNTWSLWLRLGF